MENNERVIDPSFLEVIKETFTGEVVELVDEFLSDFNKKHDGIVSSLNTLWIDNPDEAKGSVRTLIKTLIELEAYSSYWGDGDFGNVLSTWIKYPIT